MATKDPEGRIRRDVVIAKCMSSTEAYIKTLLWIRPKEGDEQFGRAPQRMRVWKPLQVLLYDTIRDLRAQRLPVRVIVLKARQQGCSTGTAAINFARCATRLNERALVIGHSDKNASELLAIYTTFLNHLPDWIRPLTRAENRNEIVFQNPKAQDRSREPGLGSRISIDTARDTDAGAGYTVTLFHGSEVAREGWRNAPALFGSLDQSMPQPHVNPNTIQVLESTAQGQQGYFYDLWRKAEKGECAHAALFVGFWQEPTYALPIEAIGLTAEQILSDLDEHERALVGGCKERYDVEITPEQLAWRRWGIRNLCQNSVELFNQEYPWCPEVAFQASGSTVFDLAGIAAARGSIRLPMVHGKLQDRLAIDPEHWSRSRQPDPLPVHDPDGFVRIYATPEKGDSIILVLDTSDGFADSDFQATQCWRFREGRRPEQVAVVEMRADLKVFVDQTFLLGQWCEKITGKRALYVPEMNHEGKYVSSRLLQHGALVHVREDDSKLGNVSENRYGFRLNKSTKPKGRQALQAVILNQTWIWHDARSLDQVADYVVVKRPDGSTEYEGAPRGIKPPDPIVRKRMKLYDDLVDGAMILAYLEMDLLLSLDRRVVEEESKPALDTMYDKILPSPLYDGRQALDPYGERDDRRERENWN